MTPAEALRADFEAKAVPLLNLYRERFAGFREQGKGKADVLARITLELITMKEVLVPRLNGPESRLFSVNYDFENRTAMEIVGMHSNLVSGVATYGTGEDRVAVGMVSGNGYTNRDLGGVAEAYMGTDIAVLAAPGSKGDQTWDDTYVRPLVKAHTDGTPVRLFRQHASTPSSVPRHATTSYQSNAYRYCGLYRIADRWRCRVQFSEEDCTERENMTCFVKLERLPGQAAVIPVTLKPKNRRRRQQHDTTILNLKGLSTPGTPEHCSNCYLDGDGRNDYYDCDGCTARLRTRPALPAPCRIHKCSERAVKCIHTVSSSLCPECVDESDEAEAEREDSSWCCALCADFYNLWSRRTRTDRGIFLKTVRLDRAKLGVTDEAENAPGSAELSKTIVQLANSDAIGDGAGPSNTNKNNNTTSNNKRRRQQSQQREDTQVGNGAGPSNQAKTTPRRQQPQQQQPALAIDMLDAVLRALYTHPELDEELVRNYVHIFIGYAETLRISIGQTILNFTAEPSPRSLKTFLEGMVRRQSTQ